MQKHVENNVECEKDQYANRTPSQDCCGWQEFFSSNSCNSNPINSCSSSSNYHSDSDNELSTHETESDAIDSEQNPPFKQRRHGGVVVERRNARERGRVKAVNEAFTRLRLAVPIIAGRSKRVSKKKTLQKAVQYIQQLTDTLSFHH